MGFTTAQFNKINGFPNNFWGWGGEDDEIYKRVIAANFEIEFPTRGSIVDMENMNLNEKINHLKANRVWKCMNKNEVLDEHTVSWKANGLSNLKYKELSRSEINQYAVVINVDVMLNHHWTDLVCDENNSQLDHSVDEIKSKFNKLKSTES